MEPGDQTFMPAPVLIRIPREILDRTPRPVNTPFQNAAEEVIRAHGWDILRWFGKEIIKANSSSPRKYKPCTRRVHR
jgi:hypothetical protein